MLVLVARGRQENFVLLLPRIRALQLRRLYGVHIAIDIEIGF